MQRLQPPSASQDHAIPRELVSLREEIGTCDQKLTQYRAALDSGADPAVVSQWMTETQAANWPPTPACAPRPAPALGRSG